MAKTEGETFHRFLRQAAVYRQPVAAKAFASLGDQDLLDKGVDLTLFEREQAPGHAAVYWVMPVIRDSQWDSVPESEKPGLHQLAYDWYDARIEAEETEHYDDREEAVHHALASGNIIGACHHAILLGNYLSDLLLYRDRLRIQTQVAGRITEKVIAEAVKEKNADVATLLNELGFVLKDLGDYRTAIDYYDKALAIFTVVYGSEHPSTKQVQENIAALKGS